MSDIYTGWFQGKVSTKTDPLTVRESASTSSQNQGQLAKGDTSHCYEGWYINGNSSSNAAWILVYESGHSGGFQGCVKARYITWLPSYSYNTSVCFQDTITVASGEYVNLRETPSTKATVIGKLHNNDQILVLYRFNTPNSGWTHVATASGTGWVMTKFIAGKG